LGNTMPFDGGGGPAGLGRRGTRTAAVSWRGL